MVDILMLRSNEVDFLSQKLFAWVKQERPLLAREADVPNIGLRVNNVFGEGTSPKLRSLRDGLNALGINSDEMLQHGIEKVVYGVTVVSNCARYLLRLDDAPQYLFSLDEAQASTTRIAQHWFERWASSRMGRSETDQKLMMHTLIRPIRHGARVVLPSDDADQLVFRID